MKKDSDNKTQRGGKRLLRRRTRTRAISWLTALRSVWRSAVRLDRSQLTVTRALLSTAGFIIPLIIGTATGHILEGVVAAGGAAGVGAVGLTYTYRARARTMLLASLGVAVSAFIGGVTGGINWLAILIAGIWGIGAGLLVAISQSAMTIGLQSTVALIVFAHFALSPAQVLIQAMLMCAGGLLQTLLVSITFPWQRFGPERAALSNVYQVLAESTEDPESISVGGNFSDAFVKAETAITDNNPHSQSGKIFYELLEEVERIRLQLILLAEVRQYLIATIQQHDGSVVQLDRVMQCAATILRRIALELKSMHPSTNLMEPQQQIEKVINALQQQSTTDYEGSVIQQMSAYCETLLDQLRRAGELAGAWRPPGITALAQASFARHKLRLRNPLEILRANLTLRSTAFRHAIRMGIALAIATALYRVFPLQRGYWVPLTTLLVLRQDFTATFTRGIARTEGTMLGAILTTLLVAALSPAGVSLIILEAVVAFLAFSVLMANYTLFSSFVTAETVLLITFADPQPLATVAYRTIDTAIGGVLALVIYALWPTWEHTQVPDNIATRLDALRCYFIAVMGAYAHPERYDPAKIHHLRHESRLTFSNAQASVEHSLSEPEHRIDPGIARGLLTGANSIAMSTLALEAHLMDNPSRHPLPEITPFTNEIDAALRTLATIVRAERMSEPLPKLQDALEHLQHIDGSEPDGAQTDPNFVITEASRIIDSINNMNQLLSTRYRNARSQTVINPIYAG
ncbi:MAG: FUSC family protein [Chloroflexi bacterium]|nr:FUSC family protein [Chloroflexota bacterium]